MFRYVLVVQGLLLLGAKTAHADALSGSHPNVILIMTDDQGYGPIGRHGNQWINTPHLDALYDSSVRFTRMLVSPTCSPTRSALMTGRDPMRNGVTHTIVERERMTLQATTLPQVLTDAGYATGIFGKWHLGDEDEYQPNNRGFQEAFIHGAGGIGQAYNCSCADVPGNKYFDPIIRHNGMFVQTHGFCTDVFFDAAVGWIKEVKDTERPFFAYISTNAPHGPFIAPPENAARFKKLGFSDSAAGFYGMIENIDENIGRMMNKLKQWDLLKDTVVIFMSDNGMSRIGLGRDGTSTPLGRSPDGRELFHYNAGMKGLKNSVDEGGCRVPLFVRWDGKMEAGTVIDRIVAHIDIFPTIAALAGAAVPEGQVEGRSLLPLIENPKATWPDRYLFTHRGRWNTGVEPNTQQWQNFAVRNQRFRLVGNDELYDMQADPGQKTNVIDQYPTVADAMRDAYDQWWNETRPMMVNESAPMSPTRPFQEHFKRQQETLGIPSWQRPKL